MSRPRIIAGEWRGRALATPDGATTRPTASRARETLFSMLTSRLGGFSGLRVADLFAGSGALGLEALSRGADSALFFERDTVALRALRQNIAMLGAQPRAQVMAGDVAKAGAPPVPFDLILADPPYGGVDLAGLVDRLIGHGWLASGGLLCVEGAAPAQVQPQMARLVADRVVGKAMLHLFEPA